MAEPLLAGLLAQAQRSEPQVRAAALLRIARVQTAYDREEARRTYKQALEEIGRIPGNEGAFLAEHARLFAAAVAPDLMPDPGCVPSHQRQFEAERIGKTMLEHQHGDAAYEYLMRYDDDSTFPYAVVVPLVRVFHDDERAIAVIRRAVAAFRAAARSSLFHSFVYVIDKTWTMLPAEEAREVVRDIVRETLSGPDWPVVATYDPEETVRITSGRQDTLFTILHILRRLDGALADSLIEDHPQLAAAANRFPNGLESIQQEADQRRQDTAGACGGGYVMMGASRDIPYLQALITASQGGDFGPVMQHALDQYRDDARPDSPNGAPKEFWPSTCRFRDILFQAGKRIGRDAAVLLARIPDADVRLLAEIELAAALAGLPALPGLRREYRRR